MLHDLYPPLIQLKNYNCTLANTPEHFSKVQKLAAEFEVFAN